MIPPTLFHLLFFLIILRFHLFWTAIWQLKDYRWDRFSDFLSTPEGKKALLSKSFFLQLVFIILLIISQQIFPQDIANVSAGYLFLAYLLFELFINIRRIAKKQFVHPKYTIRANLTILFSIIISSLLVIFFTSSVISTEAIPKLPLLISSWLLILVISILITSVSVLFLFPLARFAKHLLYQKAKKILSVKEPKIVGITGSYGKSSVKEFSYQLLKDFLPSVKTDKNINSEIGVAQTVMRNQSKDFDLFIAEMGAYGKKEIATICKFCPPDISILTAINEQHLGLFKSLKNIVIAKSEIIQGSKEGATIILNYDNKYIRELPIPTDKKVLTYGIENSNVDLFAASIHQDKETQHFKLQYKGKSYDFSTQLLGKHNIQNILGAIGIAVSLGMDIEEIQSKVKDLSAPEKTLHILKRDKLILIDDSYNANPDGVKAALAVLEHYALPKIVVLDDIVELGKATIAKHKEIAALLAKADLEKICLVGKNYSTIIIEELKRLGNKTGNILTKKEEINAYLKDQKEAVILFEGRASGKFISK